jgi:cytochrome c biogenesis protein CcdA
MTDVSLLGAFLAGLVSFLSPCVLPLVPGYISMLSGIGMEQLRQGQPPRAFLSFSFPSALRPAPWGPFSAKIGPCWPRSLAR